MNQQESNEKVETKRITLVISGELLKKLDKLCWRVGYYDQHRHSKGLRFLLQQAEIPKREE